MTSPRLLMALTVLNLALLAAQALPLTVAQAGAEPHVLRARGLEIVDAQGRLRATLMPHPSGEEKTGDSGVLLRLITPDGKPAVKIEASERGSGIMLMGEGQGTYARLGAKGQESALDLTNRNATPLRMTPAGR